MFSNYKKIEDLEDAYDTAKKKLILNYKTLMNKDFN